MARQSVLTALVLLVLTGSAEAAQGSRIADFARRLLGAPPQQSQAAASSVVAKPGSGAKTRPVRIVAASPDSEVKLASGNDWQPAREGMTLQAGDYLSTGHRAQLILECEGPAYVLVHGLTQLRIERNEASRHVASSRLFLRIGSVRAKVSERKGHRADVIIATPAGEFAVGRGQKQIAYAEEFGARIASVSGKANARAARDGSVKLASGDAAALVTRRVKGPHEVYRDRVLPDFTATGSDEHEREAARQYGQAIGRPLSDPISANTLDEQASLASGDSALSFRFEILTLP